MNAVQKKPTELDQRATYARLIGDGVDPVTAATRAGYADPDTMAFLLSQDLSIVKAARRWQFVRHLNGANLNEAQAALGRVLRDPTSPPHILMQAINRTFAYAGLDPEHGAHVLDENLMKDHGKNECDKNVTDLNSVANTLQKLIDIKVKIDALAAPDDAPMVDVTPQSAAPADQFASLGV